MLDVVASISLAKVQVVHDLENYEDGDNEKIVIEVEIESVVLVVFKHFLVGVNHY